MISDLTNGQIGNLEDVIRTEDKKIEILIVKLKDENAGKNNIRQHPNLSQKYPNCVFIRRISIQYAICDCIISKRLTKIKLTCL